MDNDCGKTGKVPTIEELQEFAKDPSNYHYVGLLEPCQPGVRLFYARLELDHYSPETSRSGLLKLSIIEWFGVKWLMISAPRSDGHILKEVAIECGLEIDWGTPVIPGPEGLEKFPINGDNVFSLINPADHPVYKSQPVEIKAMMDRETFQVMLLNMQWEYRN